jgi:hypothetical protein
VRSVLRAGPYCSLMIKAPSIPSHAGPCMLARRLTLLQRPLHLKQVWLRFSPEYLTMSTPAAAPEPANVTPTQQQDAAPLEHQPEDPTVRKCIENMKKLYMAKDTKEQDAVVDSAYAPNAVFDDNLFHVTGTKNIKVQFHAVAKIFKYCKVVPQSSSIEPLEGGGSLVKLLCLQEYGYGRRTIPIDVDTELKLDDKGMIVSHYDVWRNKFNNFGICKRLGGSATSMLMRLFKY